ncbi:unnamed protein product [Caenorhabditis angaria]|uniref:Uncharacterized protein n=1 Tax=Caenorhabditis angaria TaxID=860376 RepID=A0A9P1I9N6_9PELO|nr:unnamed protein product [Caenorhabditis angaria]
MKGFLIFSIVLFLVFVDGAVLLKRDGNELIGNQFGVAKTVCEFLVSELKDYAELDEPEIQREADKLVKALPSALCNFYGAVNFKSGI